MTIIVEDGSGLSNSVSYVSAADATAYFLARGNATWAALSDAVKEECLVRATDFMVERYRLKWKGRRFSLTQALDWPRVGVTIEDPNGSYPQAYGLFEISYTTVPTEVKNACAELALRASIAALSEDQSTRVLQETIGPITVKYDQYAPQSAQYVQVEGILKPFLNISSGGGMMKLTRC